MCPLSPTFIEISEIKTEPDQFIEFEIGDVGVYEIRRCNTDYFILAGHRVIEKFENNNKKYYLFAGDDTTNRYEFIPQEYVLAKVIWSYPFGECGQPKRLCDKDRETKILINQLQNFNQEYVYPVITNEIKTHCPELYNFSLVDCY